MHISVRISETVGNHARLEMWLNRGKVSGDCGMFLRLAEVVPFLIRLDPDAVEIKREMVSPHLLIKLHGLKNAQYY